MRRLRVVGLVSMLEHCYWTWMNIMPIAMTLCYLIPIDAPFRVVDLSQQVIHSVRSS